MDFGKVEETKFFVLYAFYVADYMTNLTRSSSHQEKYFQAR